MRRVLTAAVTAALIAIGATGCTPEDGKRGESKPKAPASQSAEKVPSNDERLQQFLRGNELFYNEKCWTKPPKSTQDLIPNANVRALVQATPGKSFKIVYSDPRITFGSPERGSTRKGGDQITIPVKMTSSVTYFTAYSRATVNKSDKEWSSYWLSTVDDDYDLAITFQQVDFDRQRQVLVMAVDRDKPCAESPHKLPDGFSWKDLGKRGKNDPDGSARKP